MLIEHAYNNNMLTNQQYEDAANCLKMLAQPFRLKIVDLLLEQPNLTVNEIAEAIECSQSLTSEHLKLLRLCNFLKAEKNGRSIHYQVIEEHLPSFIACIYKKFGEAND